MTFRSANEFHILFRIKSYHLMSNIEVYVKVEDKLTLEKILTTMPKYCNYIIMHEN